MTNNGYRSAEKFIFSRELFGMKLGLENIARFLKDIGSPQENFKSIHIAGTNGKGSTAAMLAAIAQAQGYKTGLYTSPHLVDFRERIKINNERIPKTSVASFIRKYNQEIRKRKLTFFEVVTALALDYFAKQMVEVAIIETGLGGRLDATNVLNPVLTITTDIDFDHVEILGTTLKKISEEKAGIIKSGRPHLIGMLPDDSTRIISRLCKQLHAPLFELSSKDYRTDIRNMSLDFDDGGLKIADLKSPLYGPHQLKNTALVLKAISVLNEDGFKVTEHSIRSGIKNTNWPGRFQVIENDSAPFVVLDVAHNTGGIAAFIESFKLRFPNRRVSIIGGFVRKKNHAKIISMLSEIAEEFYLVPVKTKRSMPPNELLETIDFRQIPVTKAASVASAFVRLTKKAANDDIICVVGSHYLVGEFLKDFREKWAKVLNKRQIQSRPRLRRIPLPSPRLRS
jgi:dihydrofolate synthase/folylpolyglutamate synthase